MRLIKMFLFVMMGLALIFTLFGLVMPSSAKLARGIIVQADSVAVQAALSNTTTWQQWMPWLTADPQAVILRSASTNQPGSWLQWKGASGASAGMLTITGFVPGEIQVLHQFKDMNNSQGGFRVRRLGNETEVQWFLEYPLRWYPWERFYGIFLDHILGLPMDQGLQQFKQFIEAPAGPVIKS